MQKQAVILSKNLSRRFGNADEKGTLAVDNLSLSVHRGEVFGFLGHNGAGKTTTVRLLNGVLAPTSGMARVLDMDPSSKGPTLRRRTGVLTETPALDEKLTAREQLTLYAQIYNVPARDIQHRITALLCDFELDGRDEEPVGGYSKGMKQRLALARTLLHQPELLFLDEPTGGLDPVATRHVHQLIQRLSQSAGRTIFLCTHNLNEAQKLCDRVAVMEHGKLVAIGPPKTLAQDLWKGTRLAIEVATDTAQLTCDTAQTFPGIREITQHQDTNDTSLTLISAWLPERDMIPDLLHKLVNGGARIYRITPQEPSLEDVYFALHEMQTGGK